VPETDVQVRQDTAFVMPYVKPVLQTFANPLYSIIPEVVTLGFYCRGFTQTPYFGPSSHSM
jgi:hypothetical protein